MACVLIGSKRLQTFQEMECMSTYLEQEVADLQGTAPWAVSCLQQPAPQLSSGETAGGPPAVLLLPQPQQHTQPADT